MTHNDGFKCGLKDELDRVPVPVDLPLKGYEFYQGYHAGRRCIKKIRPIDRLTPTQ